MATRRRRRRWWLGAAGGLVAVFITWIVFVVTVIGHPPITAHPDRADAIVVLGPSNKRVAQALSLAGQLNVDRLVLSIGDFTGQEHTCDQPDTVVTCFIPDPYSTSGEAAEVGRLARQEHWHDVIVIAPRPQAARARYLIGKCFAGTIQMVAATNPETHLNWAGWVYQAIYQSGAWVKALFDDPCSSVANPQSPGTKAAR